VPALVGFGTPKVMKMGVSVLVFNEEWKMPF
jgi:hypothetical protein